MPASEAVLTTVKEILKLNVDTGTYLLPADLLDAIALVEQGREDEVNVPMYAVEVRG